MSQSYDDCLVELCQADEKFIILTAENRAAIRSLPERIPNQFFDTGITEQTLVGVCAGLALRGRTPFAHALAAFLTMRAYEFIRTDIGIPKLPVKLVGFVPGLLSDGNGPTHQAIEDIDIMSSVPGMQIFCPADTNELIEGVQLFSQEQAPTYIRYIQRQNVFSANQSGFDRIWQGSVFGTGSKNLIISTGFLSDHAHQVFLHLASQGYDCKHWHIPVIEPFPQEKALRLIHQADNLFILEDHRRRGGLGQRFINLKAESAFTATLNHFDFGEGFFVPGRLDEVLKTSELDVDSVLKKIKEIIESRKVI